MASKNTKTKREERPPVAAAAGVPAPGVWETRIRPLLERRAFVIAILLIGIGAARIASTWSRFCFTNDEPQHFACGIEYLQKHVYQYERLHPPLARAALAMLPWLDGSHLTGQNAFRDREGVAIIYQNGNPQRTLILMRVGILPFFILASMVVFLWARHHFGGPIAVLSVALFTLEPTVLAHSGLATTDMALAACLTSSFFAMILWAENPTRRNTILFGVASGLALLAKYTTLLYLPVAAIFALLCYLAVHRPGIPKLRELIKQRAPSLTVAMVIGAAMIWAGYFFSFGRLAGVSFPVPAPEWFAGIREALAHNEGGHPTYLLGQFGRNGWWYYFPVVLAVKTPIAFLLLALLGAVLCFRHKAASWWLPVAYSLGILLPAMTGHINIGLRHILPIYAGLSIAGGVAIAQLAEWGRDRRWAGVAAVAALLWVIAAGVWNHPYYLAYFNEVAAAHPENFIVDSDLDWSQDYVEVAERLRAMNVTEVNFGFLPWLNQYFEVWPGFPKTKQLQPLIPAAGWAVVSPTADKLNQYGLMHRYPNLEPWWDKLTPVGKVGSTWFYFVRPDAIRLKQPGAAAPAR